MIIVVDDQPEVLEFLTTTLESGGHEVKAFSDAQAALNFAKENPPPLIISDMIMPDMDGIAFRRAYQDEFPRRSTPFIFLSSQGDPETVVRSLETGVEDYLLKPIHPEILKVKVRNALSRRLPAAVPAFHGDLGKFPLVKILQFCETRGLTGTVEIPVREKTACLRFVGGQIDLNGDEEESRLLDLLYDQEEGTFCITPQQVDFTPLADVASPSRIAEPLADTEKPMGKLSGVKVNQRLFQIQTEFVVYPEHQVLSVVILDGKVLLKRSLPTTVSEREALARLIEEQHQKVEAEVRGKTAELGRVKKVEEESPREKLGRLVEAGFEHYHCKEYQKACDCWSEAQQLDPENRTIATNLAIVRKRLE